jgi:hypothetical protein
VPAAPLGRLPRLPVRGPRAAERAAIERAWARIRPLGLYPRPLDTSRVRLIHAPRLFRLPWFSRFDGYTIWSLIFLRDEPGGVDEDLIAHELVHVWQQDHGWPAMWLSYLRGYADNPNEIEARAAVTRTR